MIEDVLIYMEDDDISVKQQKALIKFFKEINAKNEEHLGILSPKGQEALKFY